MQGQYRSTLSPACHKFWNIGFQLVENAYFLDITRCGLPYAKMRSIIAIMIVSAFICDKNKLQYAQSNKCLPSHSIYVRQASAISLEVCNDPDRIYIVYKLRGLQR